MIGMFFAACLALAVPAQAENGRLLIVGGGLSLDNEAVYSALIDNRPADAPGIAIIAAASGSQAGAATFAGELMFYGVEPADIVIVDLALVDDPETPDVDESDWAANAANPEEIAKIENAGAIWFTGGDQLRLNRALVRPGGFDSPMLAAIRERLRAGAIIGGTSAGAAAMSSPMIVRGDPFEALFRPVGDMISESGQSGDQLTLITGLRLFSPFIVDQHFAQRGRIGRLARAIMTQPQPARIGMGIDEDTALLVDLAQNEARVIGRGSVTVFDGREASVSGNGFTDVDLSRLHDGDMLNLATLAVTPTTGRERVTDRQSVFGGLWPSVRLTDPLETQRRQLFAGEQRHRTSAEFEARFTEGKRGAVFTLSADTATRYWRNDADEGWNGTLTGVRVSLRTGAAQPYRH
jgi:cyanophycinase